MNKEKEIQNKYKQGKSAIDLAKEYDLSRERVYQYLRMADNYPQLRRLNKEKNMIKRATRYDHLKPEVFERRSKGESVLSISKDLGINYKAIKDLVTGTRYDNAREGLSERNEAIRQDYKGGMKQSDIAKKYNLGQPSVSAIVNK